MDKNPVLYKTLVVGVIVLFIGMGVQPAYAYEDIEQNIIVKNYKNGDTSGIGLILCNLWQKIRNPVYPFYPGEYLTVPLTGTIIKCKDLDTGITRIGIAKLGLKLFKFLPIGHDYKITFGIILQGEERYIYNFSGFARVDILIDYT